MQQIVNELTQIVNEFTPKLHSISESDFSAKPNANKWSKKEVIGHLIDSAQNNLRRFIVGQYDKTPSKITYQQDFWVSANNYQNRPGKSVIALWQLINEQIAAVLTTMPKEKYSAQSETSELHTLEWLAGDYVKHMKHHLNQAIPGSFDIKYS